MFSSTLLPYLAVGLVLWVIFRCFCQARRYDRGGDGVFSRAIRAAVVSRLRGYPPPDGGRGWSFDYAALAKRRGNKQPLPSVVLVTGGAGFLGVHICDALLLNAAWGIKKIVIFDVRSPPETQWPFNDPRVRVVVGDLRVTSSIRTAIREHGVECVIHSASPSPTCAQEPLLRAVNVTGTSNVVEACVEESVPRLVFTSTASVVYTGADQRGLSEKEAPMPKKGEFRDSYCETKAIAEQIVLAAAGSSLKNGGTISACAIRPHGIFGPKDPHFWPKLVTSARASKTRIMVGNGRNVVDFTYVGNVAHAHLLAVALASSKDVSGEAFFISNDEPMPFWDFVYASLSQLGYTSAMPSVAIPYTVCLLGARLGAVLFAVMRICTGGFVDIRPDFTPSTVQLTGTHHYYNIGKAKRALGYRPIWSMYQAMVESVVAFEDLTSFSWSH